MQRYYFHVEDGQFYPDLAGMALPGLEEARAEAINRITPLLAQLRQEFWQGNPWKMTVTDDRDFTLFVLNFMVVNAPLVDRFGHRPSHAIL